VEIFLACMAEGRLAGAASYLMVMQATLSSEQVRQHTFDLLTAALRKEDWPLARDVVRFLQVCWERFARDQEGRQGPGPNPAGVAWDR
jgi:hypothetical protein